MADDGDRPGVEKAAAEGEEEDSPLAPIRRIISAYLMSEEGGATALEGTERMKLRKSVVEGLPDSFFAEKFDEVAELLSKLDEEDVSPSELRRWLEAHERDLLVACDVIDGSISKSVMDNYTGFISGMRQVQDVDMDLTRAGIHVTNARRKLRKAKSQLVEGALRIIARKFHRQRLLALVTVMERMQHLNETHMSMELALDQRDFPVAIRHCLAVRSQLSQPFAKRLNLFDSLRLRMGGALQTIQAQVDAALKAVCLSYTASVYDRIMRAYLLLDSVAAPESKDRLVAPVYSDVSGSGGGSGDAGSGRRGAADGLTERLQRYFESAVVRRTTEVLTEFVATRLLGARFDVVFREMTLGLDLESDAAGNNAIIKGFHSGPAASDRRISKGQYVVAVNGQEVRGMKWKAILTLIRKAATPKTLTFQTLPPGGRWELSRLPFQELCAGVPPDRLVPCLLRLFEVLVDLMHNFFLICQWHREPFSDSNHDPDYLHRGGLEEEDVEADLAALAADVAARRDGRAVDVPTSESGLDEVLIRHRLRASVAMLRRSRAVIWDAMQKRMSVFLSCIKLMHADVGILDFVSIIRSTALFIRIGEQFSLGDSHSLFGSVRLRCKHFLDAFHKKEFDSLRVMLERETWQRVPLSLSSVGGVAGLVERSSTAAAAGSRGVARRLPEVSGHVLQSFAMRGNPFHVLDWDAADDYDSDADSDMSEEDDEDDEEDDEDGKAGEESKGDGEEEEEKADGYGSAHVMTTTAIRFAKATGRYVDMLECLTPVASDVFTALLQLHDFYFYVVFTTWMPVAGMRLLTDFSRPCRWPQLLTLVNRVRGELTGGSASGGSAGGAGGGGGGSSGAGGGGSSEGKSGDGDGDGDGDADSGLSAEQRYTKLVRTMAVMDADSPLTLFALAERCVAAESLRFLLRTVRSQQKQLEELLPPVQRPQVAAFLAERQQCAEQLQDLLARAMAPSLLDVSTLPASVASSSWELREIADTPSAFVTDILVKLSDFDPLFLQLTSSVSISLRNLLWQHVVASLWEALLDGLARVKKCNPEGIALMTLNVDSLNRAFLKLHGDVEQLPHGTGWTMRYIKAAYVTEPADLLAWVRDGRDDYTLDHCLGLVQRLQLKRRARQDLQRQVKALYGLVER